jgi:hypothetical protein
MPVRQLPRRMLLILITAALTLSACNVNGGEEPPPTTDLNAISTAAFVTAMAQISGQQTQTALAAPSATPAATNTPLTQATFALPTNGAASTAGNTGALPTVSFNTTPNTTPLAGFTPPASMTASAGGSSSLGDECTNSSFVADITVPDGTVIKRGEEFLKVWRIKNTGSCMWDDGFTLVFIGGDRAIDPNDFEWTKDNPKDFVEPGEEFDVTVHLTAPKAAGEYQGTWRMQNDKGYYFGTLLSVYFEVK